MKCSRCNLIFVNPQPTKKIIEQYYTDFNYEIGFQNEKIIRSDAQRTLNNLEALIDKQSGLLLDLGCGAGFFLDEAQKRGWVVKGVDISSTIVEYARKKLNLSVVKKSFYRYNPSEKYKVITLIQVIEHLQNPEILLQKMYRLLEKGGILCVATPNIESYLSKLLKEDFNYMIPPEHLFFYSSSTLNRLLSKNNFELIRTTTWGYSSDLASIIKRIIKGKNQSAAVEVKKQKVNQNSSIKRFKSFLFDTCFCPLFYKILNVNHGGSMLEIYARKK